MQRPHQNFLAGTTLAEQYNRSIRGCDFFHAAAYLGQNGIAGYDAADGRIHLGLQQLAILLLQSIEINMPVL